MDEVTYLLEKANKKVEEHNKEISKLNIILSNMKNGEIALKNKIKDLAFELENLQKQKTDLSGEILDDK